MKKLNFILVLFAVVMFFTGCGNDYLIKNTARRLNDYYLEINLNTDNMTAHVNQSVEYKNNTNTNLNNLKFMLYANAFKAGATNKPVGSLYKDRAYPNGESYGGIDILKVLVNDEEVQFNLEDIDETTLSFEVGELKPGKCVDIEFEYSLTLPNINHRFGYGNNAINLANFYPVECVYEEDGFVTNPYSSNGDPFYSNLANYLVKINYNNDYKLATTGNQTNTKTISEEKLQTTCLAQAVRDFAIVLSNKFNVATKTQDGVEVFYYYYDDENFEKSLETSALALKTFNKLIGDYPYDTLSVVQTNFVHGGMEYPNLVYISDELTSYEDYTNVIIHEIAHQWWYGVVGSNAYKNGWLDEGLTEYTTALFYEINPEYEIKLEDVVGNAKTAYTMFVEVYESVFGKVDTSLNRELNNYRTEPEYVYMAYVKAMLMYDNIRSIIGDRKFFKAIKNYYEENKMKNANVNDLLNSFEKYGGKKINGIFTSWIEGKVVIKEVN